MKRIASVCIMLFLAAAFISVQSAKTSELSDKIDEAEPAVTEAFDRNDTDTILHEISELKTVWDSVQPWIGMTVDADTVEEIDISLSQCERYAEIEAREDFIGEFMMLSHIIRHLPYFESMSAESLL